MMRVVFPYLCPRTLATYLELALYAAHFAFELLPIPHWVWESCRGGGRSGKC